MAKIEIDDDGYTGRQLARLTEDSVIYTMREIDLGTKIIPAHEVFEVEMALAVLLANEVVFINSPWWREDLPEADRKLIQVFVNCNDVFAWGAADAEELPLGEIETLYRMWLKDSAWGPAVWCIIQRGYMPQKPVENAIKKAGIWNLEDYKLLSNEIG